MSIEITFVRHGETDANAAGIWQGQGNAALSEMGRAQAESLRARLHPDRYDVVVSSDLARTIETAALAGLDPILDPGWREMDIGAWEGLSRAEVHERFPDEARRLSTGDQDVPMGGGESWRQFGQRVNDSLERLSASTPAGSRVLVMAHGGVIHAALSWGLGFRGRRPWPVSRIRNAAITEVVVNEQFHLQTLNDVRHVPIITGDEGEGGIPIALIRHGETDANVAGEWHGRTDGPLTERGRSQGAQLAAVYDGIARVFASPLERTRHTAESFAAATGLDVELAPGLIEIDFGEWEGLTTSEIEETFPDDFRTVFFEGTDLPRGGSGETFAGAGERIEREVRDLADTHNGQRLALFSHAGVIWALAARLLGIDWPGWRKLAFPSNASLTHVRYDRGTPILVDYNLPLA